MIERVARISWLTAEQGGRKAPPSGPRYVAPVRFEDETEQGAVGAVWSLVVELLDRSSDATIWTARIRFLVEETPGELLKDDARFELYEGAKCVARGMIVPGVVGSNVASQHIATPHQVR